MRRSIALVLLLAAGTPLPFAQASDALAPLQFLLGRWEAIDRPAGETGTSEFTLDVQGHVIIRTNEAVYPATADRPASRQDDLMVIYSENGALKADYFDSEGHVIRYSVRVNPGTATFVSAPGPRDPRYRLVYRAGEDGVLNGSFDVAPPGSPDAFKDVSYVEGTQALMLGTGHAGTNVTALR